MQTLTKKENGTILLEQNGIVQTLSKYATLKIESRREVTVQQTQGQSVSIFIENLQTIVEPTGAVSWGTTVSDLVNFLNNNFFFDVGESTGNWVFVEEVDDLPAPVTDMIYFAPLGVIYLEPDTTYVIAVKDLDLGGARLQTTGKTTIIGGSSETSSITSTGLGSAPLIYSSYTLAMQFLTIKNVSNGYVIEGTSFPPVALDWTGVNFENCPNIGVIYTCDNFIFTKGALLNSSNMVFDGTFGTIGFEFSLLQGDGNLGDIIRISPLTTILRRFRIVYSSIIAFGATRGINADLSAVIDPDGYIIKNCNFSGGGSYLGAGINYTDNRALFEDNKGIINSSAVSQYYMNNNAVLTAGVGIGTPVKVEGSTLSSLNTIKFNNTDNSAEYTGAFPRFFSVTCTYTIESGNNQQIAVYIAKNGIVLPESKGRITTNGSGRAEGAVSQTTVILETGDIIEAYAENESTGGDFTVVDLNMVII